MKHPVDMVEKNDMLRWPPDALAKLYTTTTYALRMVALIHFFRTAYSVIIGYMLGLLIAGVIPWWQFVGSVGLSAILGRIQEKREKRRQEAL